MRHSLVEYSRPQALVYVFWEPTSAVAEFSAHRGELEKFSVEVAGSHIRFLGLSYEELWEEWEEANTWPRVGEHVVSLRARYALSV